MRVLFALSSFIIGAAILGGLGFLIAREGLLLWGGSQVRSSVSQMRRIATNTGVYIQECKKKGVGGTNTTSSIESIQLRFTSPTTYVLEVVCRQHTLDPILVETVELPMFVEKTPGSSGLVWNGGFNGIGLEIWGRSRAIYLDDGDIWYDSVETTAELPGPLTTCSGHGFSCCQAETSVGVGTLREMVTDCPRSCYAVCESRPLVLSLTTQPFYDQKTRTVQIKANEPLEIGYVVDPQGAESLSVELRFGDGNTQQFSTGEGRGSHTYSCSQVQCNYEMTVVATNEQGVDSIVTPISKVQVVVTR